MSEPEPCKMERTVPVTILRSEGECLYPCDRCDELVCDLASVDGDLLCVSCLRKKTDGYETELGKCHDMVQQLRADRDKLHSTARTVLDNHIWDVSSRDQIGKISLEGFILLVEVVDEAEPLISNALTEKDAVTQCKCFNFYRGQNAYNFCPHCGRDLR